MSETTTWLAKHCTCFGAPDETGYIDPDAGPEGYACMIDPACGSTCSQSPLCVSANALEARAAALDDARAALVEAYEFQSALNYMKHGTDELIPDGSIPRWYVNARAALAKLGERDAG